MFPYGGHILDQCKYLMDEGLLDWGSLSMGAMFQAVSSPKVGFIITNLQDACEDPSPTLSYETFGYTGYNIGLVGGFTLDRN